MPVKCYAGEIRHYVPLTLFVPKFVCAVLQTGFEGELTSIIERKTSDLD